MYWAGLRYRADNCVYVGYNIVEGVLIGLTV